MANRIETGIKQVFQRPNGLFVFCKHHKNTNIQALSTRDAFMAALMARNLMIIYLQHQDEELESIRSRLYRLPNSTPGSTACWLCSRGIARSGNHHPT